MPSTLDLIYSHPDKNLVSGDFPRQANKQIKLVSHFTFSQFSHVTDIFPKGRKDGGDSSNTNGSSGSGRRHDILARYIL